MESKLNSSFSLAFVSRDMSFMYIVLFRVCWNWFVVNIYGFYESHQKKKHNGLFIPHCSCSVPFWSIMLITCFEIGASAFCCVVCLLINGNL